jgi:DNA (cytosine-5)-methyltransferase 1
LPELLERTLIKQSASKNEPESQGGAKEYSYNMSEQEHCQQSTTKVYCLQGNGIDRADTAGCNGKGWREDQSYTLNTIDRHGVCTYQQTTGTLCASGYDKLGVQEALNDMYVIGTAYDGSQISPTLTANNANGAQRMPDKENFNAVITYGLDRASFNQGQNAQYDFSIEEEKAQTIVSRGPGGVLSRQSVPYVQETTKE